MVNEHILWGQLIIKLLPLLFGLLEWNIYVLWHEVVYNSSKLIDYPSIYILEEYCGLCNQDEQKRMIRWQNPREQENKNIFHSQKNCFFFCCGKGWSFKYTVAIAWFCLYFLMFIGGFFKLTLTSSVDTEDNVPTYTSKR